MEEWKGNNQIFRGYFHGKPRKEKNGKIRCIPTEKIKENPYGHRWEDVRNDSYFGAVLNPDFLDVSFDYEDCEPILKMVKENKWNCLILENPENKHPHLFFRKPDNYTHKDGNDIQLACGVLADIHSGDTLIPLRINNVSRFPPVYDSSEYQKLPPELWPVSGKSADEPGLIGLAEGNGRNDKLSKWCMTIAVKIQDRDTVRRICENINEFIFAEPMEQSEVDTILRDETFEKVESEKKRSEIKIVNLKDIQPKRIEFLYEPYIPRGKISLVGAYPGVGKTFLCCYLAACVSTGKPFFEVPYSQTEPGRVLYITTEDGIADTIIPRLNWCHADMSMISSIEDPKAELKFSAVDKFEQILKAINPILVILDPFQSFLGGKVDGNSANEIRALMNPMIALAEKYNTAFIFICHYNKNAKGDAITRIIGSMDTVAAARSYMALGNVPKNTNGQKYMSHEKSSGQKAGDTVLFHIDPKNGGVVFDGMSKLKESDYADLRRSGNNNSGLIVDAESLIRENLIDGRCKVKDIIEAGKDAGISTSTMHRARHKLGMTSIKDGFQGAQYWVMPSLEEITKGVEDLKKSLDNRNK